jgi:hypothetical protein
VTTHTPAGQGARARELGPDARSRCGTGRHCLGKAPETQRRRNGAGFFHFPPPDPVVVARPAAVGGGLGSGRCDLWRRHDLRRCAAATCGGLGGATCGWVRSGTGETEERREEGKGMRGRERAGRVWGARGESGRVEERTSI